MTKRACTIGISLLLAVGTAFAQEKVALKHEIPAGDYEVTSNMRVVGATVFNDEAASQPASADLMTKGLRAAMSLSKPDKDGVKKGSFTYRRIAYGLNLGSEPVNYDSEDSNTASSPIGPAMKPLVGAKISFEATPDGNVRNLARADDILEVVRTANPKLAPVLVQMNRQFGEGEVIQMMHAAGSEYLPPMPVAAGDTWKARISMDVPTVGPVIGDANCRLAAIEKTSGGRTALIDFELTSALDSPTERTVGNMVVKVQRADGHQKGRIAFDMDRNMISGFRVKGELSVEMSMERPNAQKMKASSNQTTEMNLVIAPVKTGTNVPAPAKTP